MTVASRSYTLSPAELEYAQIVSAQTGLAPAVVTTWVGRESGWDVTKGSNNYLNIGPHYRFPSVSAAAAAAAHLIDTSADYSGIRQAAASGNPEAQITAIEASPWDAGHYGGTLGQDYQDVVAAAGNPPETVVKGWSWWDLLGPGLGLGEQAAKSAGGALAKGAAGAVGSAVSSSAKRIGLILLFVGAGLGLVVLGLTRLFPSVTETITHIAT